MDKIDKPICISPEDLALIQTAKNNINFSRVLAEKAIAEHKNSELESQNIILKAFLKYNLSSNDTIDNDGKINYFVPEQKDQE